MAFVPKDWRNLPDQSTPLSRDALRDMETRLATYAQSIAAAGPASLTGLLNVMDFGAKQDGKAITGSINSGTALLTGAFASADVGKYVLVPGAGAAGADLVTTIVSVNPGVSATLNAAAGTTRVGVNVIYGTNDAPAWQAAIDTCLDRRGGNILCPAPIRTTAPGSNTYSIIATSLNIPNWKGGKILGSSMGGDAFPILAYLPATGNLLHASSCLHLILEGLTFWGMNIKQASTSDLVLFDSTGTDNMGCEVKDCGFLAGVAGGLQDPNARSLLRLDQTIFSRVKGCSFSSGAQSAIELGPNYDVAILITDECNFSHTVHHILINSGDMENLGIVHNTFEPCYGGTSGAIKGTDASLCRAGLSIKDNWFGDMDAVNDGHCHIEGVAAYVNGGEISGNMFGDIGGQVAGFGGAHLNISGGPWDIHTNHFATSFSIFDMTPLVGTGRTQSPWVNFHDNDYQQNNNIFTNGTGLKGFGQWKADNNLAFGSKKLPETSRVGEASWKVINTGDSPYTLTWDDISRWIKVGSTPGTLQINIPKEADLYFPIGAEFEFVVGSAYRIHFVEDVAVTVSARSAFRWSTAVDQAVVRLRKTEVTNTWQLLGEISGP